MRPAPGRRQITRAAALGGMWLAMRPELRAAEAPTDTLLNVRQFGAKGDGKTDDTKSIQSAIDAAATRGGSVYVPPGVYQSAELQVRPHVSITGIPAWDYEHGFGSVIRLADEHARCLLNITGAFGATLDGLALDGGHLGVGVHGVWLNKPDYGKQEDTFRIERCQIANFSGDGVRLTWAWCFSIRHSMIAYNAGDGISLRGWDGFLLDNWLSGNHGAGFAAREENASCTFTANRIEWNREGMLIIGGNGYNITGNFFDRAGTCGLTVLGGKQMSITGNFVKRSGKIAAPGTYDSSQIRLERTRGITCCGNNLQAGRDDNARGVWSPSYGIVYKELQNCVIANNVLDDGALQQLMVDLGGHGEGLVVKDNPGSLTT
ncbi:MAG: right-handed parallel beta-helix repeat-containing protein [Acidobacteriota bacterium]|nr:right-handed parallel beta-helix repeat-containing protein [Acidobacteriota bacterium]